MAREYHLEQNKQRLILAYGKHAVRGTLISHETTAVGSGLQVKFRRALGIGEWDACEALYYKENEAARTIPSANFHFHSGGATDAADALFPTAETHPGIVYDSVQLPVGISAENKPEHAIGIYRCLKVADYSTTGSQTGFAYSPNFARVAADLIKRCRSDRFTQLIDWGAWKDWRDWCLANITATIDGASVQIPRFEAHVFLIPPFSLEDALDRLCQFSCSNWQWVNGKIRFLAPVDRSSVFTFNLAEIGSDSFKYTPADKSARINLIRIFYRDLRHPQLRVSEKPVEVDRRTDPNAEEENALEMDIGVADKSQAERIAEYWAKVRIDYAKYTSLEGLWNSYPVLPGDVVKVTHEVPNWTDQKLQVIEKSEDEDFGDGYPYKLQYFPTNPYSDLNHTPATTPSVSNEPDPLAPPPAASIATEQVTEISNDGVKKQVVKGVVDFGDFGFDQYAKVYLKRPGETPERFTELRPDGNNKAEFRAYDLKEGQHEFTVEAVSAKARISQTAAIDSDSETIAAADFTVSGLNGKAAIDRSLKGLKNEGSFKGFDEAVVPQAKMTAQIGKAVVVDEGLNVDFKIEGEVIGNKVDPASHGDSVYLSRVNVYDKFGVMQKTLNPKSFNGAGTVGSGVMPRKNLDPNEEAMFEIVYENSQGGSASKWLHKGALANSKPAAMSSDAPKDLAATTISSTKIRFAGNYSASGNLKLQKRAIGASPTDWEDHATGIASLPYTATVAPGTKLEWRLVRASNSAHYSNIVIGFSFPPAESVGSYPAPTGFTGAPNSSTPTTKLDCSFTAKGNVATKLFVDGVAHSTSPLSAVAVEATKTFSLTGLSAGTSYTIGIQHDYGGGNLSSLVEITVSTQAASSVNRPEITLGYFDEFSKKVVIDGNEYGSANLDLKRSTSSGGSYSTVASNITLPYNDPVAQPLDFDTYYYYKLYQSDASPTESIVKSVRVPAENSCFLAGTMITMWDGQLKAIEEIRVGDEVLSFNADGEFVKGTVARKFMHPQRMKYAKAWFRGEYESLRLTLEHRFWLLEPNGITRFECMGNLEPGAVIKSLAGYGIPASEQEWSESVLGGFEEIHTSVDVYNFHVDTKVYFADGKAAHNAKA